MAGYLRELKLHLNGPENAAQQRQRVLRDGAEVLRYFPTGTKEVVIGGTTCWIYDIVNAFDQPFTMSCYFDGRQYQVRVLSPAVEGTFSYHESHVRADGQLCLNPPFSGTDTIRDAYAKSTLWATGYTVLQQTGKFPFPSS